MKKLLIILLSALSLTAVAQQKPHIAVYVTGEDPMNEIIANRLMSSFINTGKYMPVERSSAFLAAINKEQGYQRTGEVDEEQIAALGKQFGIQYICVVSVLDVWNSEKYITSRILDVTSAEVIGSCSSNGSIANAGALMTALDDLSNKLKKVLEYSKSADFKKVAVYVSKTGNRDVDIILGDQLVAGFAHSSDYVAVERTNAFLKQIKKEGGYQQSGTVDDDDLIRMGKQFGVQYVCVARTIPWGGAYFISSRLVDVITTEVPKMYNAENKVMNSSKDVVAVAQEIAQNLSGVSSGRGGPGENFTETAWDINMKMIWVEGGEFMMGCTSEQSGCDSDEQNVRRVTVDGFYIGMLEVTQSQWEKVVGTNIYTQKNKADASGTYGVGPDYPMYYVSWEEAMEFCRLLSNKTGKTYTLPTEAQWEYAARGGKKADGTKYAGSNMIDAVAWYNDNSSNSTHPCGTKRANALGIYDMSGNVYEWCKDWYSNSYTSYDTNNPTGPSSGSHHVIHGGSWNYDATNCRVATRYGYFPGTRDSNLGFRVVLLP